MNEDRKRDYGESNSNDLFAFGKFWRKSQSQDYRRNPNRNEVLMGLVHSDQEENQRVYDESGVFPEGLDSFLSPVRDRAEKREIAHDKPRCDRGQYTRQAEMFREEEGPICGDGGENSFDEIVFGLPSQ